MGAKPIAVSISELNQAAVHRVAALLIAFAGVAAAGAPARAVEQAPASDTGTGGPHAARRTVTRIHVKGPSKLPEQFQGLWKVSLCITESHAWIRFQNADTGEVHTLGRYFIGNGALRDRETGTWIYLPAARSGVYLDRELTDEETLRSGKALMLSVLVKNPRIYRGRGNGFGHGGMQNNCTTFARDAWHYYSGEAYPLPLVHAPEDLILEVVRRHPQTRLTR